MLFLFVTTMEKLKKSKFVYTKDRLGNSNDCHNMPPTLSKVN